MADPAGNTTAGGATLTVNSPAANLFDFVFTYADGRDYYYGTVADDGSLGYRVGQVIATAAGQYDIFEEEGLPAGSASGAVSVVNYSHGGPGAASPTPLAFAAHRPAGRSGLGSEADAVLGTDGQPHAFSGTAEASFATASLFGFVFTYADGAAFYSGTVADDGRFGVTAGSRTVSDAQGHVLGSYTVFAEGITGAAAGTVVVDRFTASGASYAPNAAGQAAGHAGLGSESGTLSVGGGSFGFSNAQEPVLPSAVGTVPLVPPPGVADVIVAEIVAIYGEVLGRSPTNGELQTDSTALAGGASLAALRTGLAQSAEAQAALGALYQQIFGRPAGAGELAGDSGQLAAGDSLRSLQLVLAQSAEAQADIAAIYGAVLGRAPAGSELTAAMVELGNEAAGAPADPGGRPGLAGVRDVLAHSDEAQTGLAQLFQGVVGRAPVAPELAGLEDQLADAGSSQQTLQTALAGGGAAAAGFAPIVVGAGDASLAAQPGVATLFDFTQLAFGHDTVAGFDPGRDAIELPRGLVPDLTTLAHELADTAQGALLTINASQSILVTGIAASSLTPATNFLIV